MVNCLILLLDESVEILGSIVELDLFLEGLEELVDLGNEHPDYADNDQVKQGQLYDQKEKVDEAEQQEPLNYEDDA